MQKQKHRGRLERGEPALRRTRAGAEAGVRDGHIDAGPAGLQAPLQLLDLPPDLLPLRVQVEVRGGERSLSAGGVAGPGRARPVRAGCGLPSLGGQGARDRQGRGRPCAQAPQGDAARGGLHFAVAGGSVRGDRTLGGPPGPVRQVGAAC